MEEVNPLRTVPDLAKMTGTTTATVYQWNHAGTGPRRILVGRKVMYRQSDIDAWLESRVIEPKVAASA